MLMDLIKFFLFYFLVNSYFLSACEIRVEEEISLEIKQFFIDLTGRTYEILDKDQVDLHKKNI